MPRYYRRRYTKVVRPKKKWASNMKNVAAVINNGTASLAITSSDLVVNSAAGTTPTPVIIKTGNFKVQMDVSYTTNAASPVEIRAIIIYMPEGVTATTWADVNDLINRHPEWIIAWKYASVDFVNSGVTAGTQTFNFSSRLKRNLNSGDKVVLFTTFATTTTGALITGANVGGLCQYWTCAN